MRDPSATQSFSHNLKRVRLARAVTQEEIDRLYGATHGYVSKYERGKIEPGLLTLVALAGCLETTVDELILRPEGLRQSIEWVPHREDLPEVSRAEIAATVSTQIRKRRLDHGLSAKQLAIAANVHPRQVSHVEGAGTQRTALPGLSVLAGIAAALRLRPSDLLGGIRYLPNGAGAQPLRRRGKGVYLILSPAGG